VVLLLCASSISTVCCLGCPSITLVHCVNVKIPKDMAIVALECGQETIPKLSNGPFSMT